jgi:hypothetical protein
MFPVSLVRCHAMSYTFFLINVLFACLFTKFLSANHLSYLYLYVSSKDIVVVLFRATGQAAYS